ncbi:MAG: phosphoenolpyruvate carboxykinase (ATP) [Fimbriimonadaceae bacterium]|nr:phosphoenolpyruvate carboxykinase (ATP) [Fimbriimonadaceae bacterium]QYK55630.1 MAG: phosphoenolpyruvate carboxykinase (ATP) [Fimbriimonadaceae bacterium]
MSATSVVPTFISVDSAKTVYRNLPIAELVEHAIKNGEGRMADNGALVAYTGKYTGRTPKDKRVVLDSETKDKIWWENNGSMEPALWETLKQRAQSSLGNKQLYIVDCFAGADPDHRIKVRFVVENAYHAHFITQLLIRPSAEELRGFEPEWTVVDLSREQWLREENGEQRDAVIALNFTEKAVLILGTSYAGEMKKSVFTIMNYLLPLKGVLSMHCSANIGIEGDTALFFGLSGTGKTTLSADSDRSLIGDDEHGWTDTGVFNIEGGCYAKCIKLSKEGEPQIWDAIRFGAVLENVVMDEKRHPDYDATTLTENTRCAYPLEHIENAVHPSIGGHPKNICFLTCDASGVLPPISKLTAEQAMYHFLNGYTAKVAGTEAGVTEPQLTFSTCFGAPFLPLPPKVYAKLLGEKIERHGATVWLVNTGWTGGPYGVGSRMSLTHTRALIHAAFRGDLRDFRTDPVFGLSVPTSCPGVPDEILDPRATWSDKGAYDAKAAHLKAKFDANYQKFV